MNVVNLNVADDILNDDVVKLEATRIGGTGYINVPQALESSTADYTEALVPADYDVKLVYKDPPFLEVDPEYQIFTVTNSLTDGVDEVSSLIDGVPPTLWLEDSTGVSYTYESSTEFSCPPWSRERALSFPLESSTPSTLSTSN